MATAYASRKDVFELGGLPRGLLGNEGRICVASSSSDSFELNEHGFETDDAVSVRATGSGSLPAPLAEATTYYAIRLTASSFQLSATEGGSAIDLTTDGDEMMVIEELPFDQLLEFYSRWVDGVIPHAVPLETGDDGKYPMLVRGVVAKLVAKALLNHDGKSSQLVDAAEIASKQQLERWAAGVPVRDAAITQTTNAAITASGASDPRGWGATDTIP